MNRRKFLTNSLIALVLAEMLVVVNLMAPAFGIPASKSSAIVQGEDFAPLHDYFYNRTTMPVTVEIDGYGEPIFTVRAPVPHYNQATLIWEISSDTVDDESYAGMQQILSALHSGELTELDVRFEDGIEESPTFFGYQFPDSEPTGMDRNGAMEALLSPIQNLTKNHNVSAIAFVSAPSLNLTDIQMFFDGHIDTPFQQEEAPTGPAGTELKSQPDPILFQKSDAQPQPQPIVYENCDIRFNCAPPTPGAFCPVDRNVNAWRITCSGQVQGTFTARPSLTPQQIQAGCKIEFVRGIVRSPGQCNWVMTRAILPRNRRQICSCTLPR